ncbi:MAG: J domain-containing protein [Deltaproteobacteria bacterium]|nr:J domain-containing protein [Deltaproteobacteria bacterium]
MSSSHRGLRIAARPTATPLGKKQKRFNLLVKQAAQRRALLAEWAARDPEFERTIAEGRKLDDVHRGLVAELVRTGERHVEDKTLSRLERDLLRELLATAAFDLLQVGGFDDLKPIFNRLSGRDYDREAAAENAAHMRTIRDLFEEELGVEVGDHVRSVEDLHQFAAEKFAELKREEEEAARAAEERRAQRKKTPRQAAAEAVRVAERAQADKALQTIYRALAIALHPDREQDPVERDRKTELMREVNVAYEAKDLLKLLELQLRFEQVDQAALDTIAEDRLDHFNKLLTEQAAQLKEELTAREAVWRERLEVPRASKLTPDRVAAALRADVSGMTFTILECRADLVAFEDPQTLKRWLRGQAQARRRGAPY